MQDNFFKKKFKIIFPILTLTLLYIISAKLGLLLAFEQVNTSPVWPPTGVALAAIILGGLRLWPGVFIGSFLVNLYVSSSLTLSTSIAIGNTLEAVIAGYFILRFASLNFLSKNSETAIFIFSLFGATMISASIGVGSLVIANVITQF